jgi:hypothetical protein
MPASESLLSWATAVANAWSVPLCAADILHGVIDGGRLRVSLDIGLLVGAVLLATLVAIDLLSWRVRARGDERKRRLPGDQLIPDAGGGFTHAITITGPPVEGSSTVRGDAG